MARRLGTTLRNLATLAIFPLMAARALAQGGPPMVTDDPGTPGNRTWEINVALALESRTGEHLFETPLVDASYGLGDRIQLKAEIPWLVLDSGGATVGGLGNALMGVKYRFMDESVSGVSVAVYPQVEVGLLDSAVQKGLVETGTGAIFPVIAQRSFGRVSADVELGPLVRSGRKPRWFGGLAVGGDLSARFNVAAEVFAETSARFSDTDAAFNAGGRWRVGTNSVLLFSAGTGVHGGDEHPAAKLLAYLGFQLLI